MIALVCLLVGFGGRTTRALASTEKHGDTPLVPYPVERKRHVVLASCFAAMPFHEASPVTAPVQIDFQTEVAETPHVFFVAFCLDVRTLAFCQLMGFPLNH